MNRELVTEWAEALESDEYNQTDGELIRRESDGSFSYCCLGVFGKLNGMDLKEDANEVYVFAEKTIGRPSEFFWKMNDRDGFSFAEIAAVIRSDILGEKV